MDSNATPPSQSSIAMCKNAESIAVRDMHTLLSAPVGNNNTVTNIFNASLTVEDGNRAPTNSRDENVSNLETSRADHEIYFSQLLTKKRGFPLWVPGPNKRLPIEYRRQGISLGDVGIITSLGVFSFLFNIFQPADHPVNRGLVPQGFSPLSLDELKPDIQEHDVFGPGAYLASRSVKRVSVNRKSQIFINQKFESAAKEAAILILPDGATSEDLENTDGICDLIASNAASWYKYATVTRGRRRKLKNGDIRVVVGVDKVSSWGIATSACNTTQTAFYEFMHDPIHEWNCSAGSGRVGPQMKEIRDLIQDNTVKNQCIFVRTINFTISGEIWNNFPSEAVEEADPGSGSFSTGGLDPSNRGRSRGARGDGTGSTSSGHQPSSGPRGFNCASSVIFDPVESGVKHPSAILHRVLHEKFSDANVVISDDPTWIRVLNDGHGVLSEPNDLFNRILNTHELQYESGVVRVLRRDNTTSRRSISLARAMELPAPDLENFSSILPKAKGTRERSRSESHSNKPHWVRVLPPSLTRRSHSIQSHAPIPVPPLAVSSTSGPSSPPPLFYRSLDPPYCPWNNTDLDCELEGKMGQWDFPEKSANRQSGMVCLPSSSLPLPATSAQRTLRSSSISELLPITVEDRPSNGKWKTSEEVLSTRINIFGS